ncbi:hypothetical protein BBJ28_00015737 [Nothophytophthora sp. Chile5]|nr:hypothetical protein BBJ28_00015737 [Nothophytophthora sp. Chile5]
MGLLPPLKKSGLHFKTRLSSQKRVDGSHEVSVGAVALPQEAQRLKTQILQAHPETLLRFSMSRMRHIVTQPPVEIPAQLRSKKLISSRVAGHNVPLTRSMWDNMKKKHQKRQLDVIGEGIHYQ